MKMDSRTGRPATLCVHAGTHLDERNGGICSPVFPSTSYVYPNEANENVYPRYFNVPNQRVVAAKMAALEKGEAAVVFGSGMAAISTLLFAHLKPGDHILFQADLYGGTYHFATGELAAFGIAVSFARTIEEFRTGLRPKTRVIYEESPSNPLLRCVDLAAIAALARTHGVLSAIDNTFDLMEIKDKGQLIKGDVTDPTVPVHLMSTFPFFDAMVRLYEADAGFKRLVDEIKASL